MTLRLKHHEPHDLDGFVNLLVSNGYKVTFRSSNTGRVIMCDVDYDKCVVRNDNSNAGGAYDSEHDEQTSC